MDGKGEEKARDGLGDVRIEFLTAVKGGGH